MEEADKAEGRFTGLNWDQGRKGVVLVGAADPPRFGRVMGHWGSYLLAEGRREGTTKLAVDGV